MTDIFDLSAVETADAVNSGRLSAAEACRAYLERSESDKTNAYITVDRDGAERAAAEVDRRIACGEHLPLAGVSVAVKDNICTKGLRTTCASRMLRDFVPDYDATVCMRLRDAGAVIIGKTNMDEFAVGSDGESSYFGNTSNPLDPARTAGGSSSGSASAVAGRLALVSLGSDTGGSARLPASYCGITALKASRGDISRYGLVGMAPSLDCICPMCTDVRDTELVYRTIRGRDDRDMTTWMYARCDENIARTDISKLRIGVYVSPSSSARAVKSAHDCAAALSAAGAECVDIGLPLAERLSGIYYIISSAEASSNLARFDGFGYGYHADGVTETRSEGFGARLRERMAEGAYALTRRGCADYAEALRLRGELCRKLDELFCEYDLILTPGAACEAPRFGESSYDSDVYTVFANLSGIPALTLRTGGEALPVGVQIAANRGGEELLFRVGEFLEGVRC